MRELFFLFVLFIFVVCHETLILDKEELFITQRLQMTGNSKINVNSLQKERREFVAFLGKYLKNNPNIQKSEVNYQTLHELYILEKHKKTQ